MSKARNHTQCVEISLIGSLPNGIVPSILMTAGFAGTVVVSAVENFDRWLVAFGLMGLIFSAWRLMAVRTLARYFRAGFVTHEGALRHEETFAQPYIAFAIALGAFSCRAMMLPDTRLHMLVICMLVGYCAGVAAGVALRPRIAWSSMIAALVPALVTALFHGDPFYTTTSLFAFALLGGGLFSITRRYNQTAKDSAMRHALASMARRDLVTGMPNQLALHSWFFQRVPFGTGTRKIACHRLDVEAFRKVNDQFGRLAGDMVLRTLGERLAKIIGSTDIVARVGPNEFAILQSRITTLEDANRLADRLIVAIERPLEVQGHRIALAVVHGFSITDDATEDLDMLFDGAGEALAQQKLRQRTARGVPVSPAPVTGFRPALGGAPLTI